MRPFLKFSRNLKFQQGNVTLPGEQELTDRADRIVENLQERAGNISSKCRRPAAARRDFYRTRLLPHSDTVLDAAQQIIDINLNNMISADGQVRQQAAKRIAT